MDHTIPQHAEFHWPPAVIAGAYQTGVLGVRSLKRRGVMTASFDCNPANPGFKSNYGPSRLCPDPDSDPDAWLEFMIELSRDIGTRPALIPSSDQFVSAIARHSEELKSWYILSPGILIQGQLAEKQTQYELAAKHGMPMPRTQFVHSIEETEEFAREATFPCLIKPIHFREWRRFPNNHPLFGVKISIARSKRALMDNYELAKSVNPSVILQEIIEGPDTAKRVYLSCYDVSGKRIAKAMFRELRCSPIGFGPATITEPVVDDETDSVCNRFLKSIGYAGICEIEMKWDEKDGKVKLIEANPRLSGSGDAAPYAGVDLCWLHYLDLIGENVTPVAPSRNSFKHVVLRADAEAVPVYWKAGLIGFRDILRSYRPPLAFYDLDRRDLRYSAETLLVCVNTLLRGVLRSIFKRRSK